ncbi:9008_t:CDS:2, partial [Scutellospora calospora]
WQQHQEHIQKFAYEMFLYQNRHIQDNKDIGLEKLHSVCSRFAYETYIKQQRDFVRSGEYRVLKRDDGIYEVVQIDDQIMKTYAVQIETLSTCICLHPWRTKTLCQHIIIVYLLYLRTCVSQSKQSTFEMTNADNIIDYKEIKIIEVKHKCGHPPNNRRIPDANENKFKKAKIDKKLDKGNTFLHLFGLELDLRISQNAQDVKAAIKSQLTKWQHFYSNILGYNTDQLMNILSYIQPECSQEYWFYSLECVQIASDMFNMLVAIYSIDLMTSLLFLPFDQKSRHRKKLIILHWHGRDHIVFVKLKVNRNIQNLSLNPQYISICRRLGFSEDWFSLFT